MITAQFHVRSKTPISLFSEVLCHNICLHLQQTHEMRIEAALQVN